MWKFVLGIMAASAAALLIGEALVMILSVALCLIALSIRLIGVVGTAACFLSGVAIVGMGLALMGGDDNEEQ